MERCRGRDAQLPQMRAEATALDIAAGDLAKMANEITRLQAELSTWRMRAWLAMIGLAGTVAAVGVLELWLKGA